MKNNRLLMESSVLQYNTITVDNKPMKCILTHEFRYFVKNQSSELHYTSGKDNTP